MSDCTTGCDECNISVLTKGEKGDRGATGTNYPLTVANTIYITKSGNDSTGLVERFDKPFLTIQAAVDAAVIAFPSLDADTRIKFIVESGDYTWNNPTIHKYMDFDFGNSVITLTGYGITDYGVDFGVSDSGIFTNIIYGNAKIKSATTGAIYITGANTKVLFHCDSLITENDCIVIEDGYLKIVANLINCFGTSLNYTQCVNVYGSGLCTVVGANIINVTGSYSSTIQFDNGVSLSDCGIITLINCIVGCKTNNGAVRSSTINCGADGGSYGVLNLYNTMLQTTNSKSIYSNAGSSLRVYYYGYNMANVGVGGAGTLTVAAGTLTVDAGLIYNDLP